MAPLNVYYSSYLEMNLSTGSLTLDMKAGGVRFLPAAVRVKSTKCICRLRRVGRGVKTE